MKYENVKFGADPELFLITKEGEYRSAVGLIGGSKKQPRVIDDQGSAVQEDNVAVEFNIPPSGTKQEFVNNIQKVMAYLNGYAGERNLLLSVVPAAKFPDIELQTPQAMRFGCDPDLNVWSGTLNAPPELDATNYNLRSCGGHVHVSWTPPKMEEEFMAQGEELVRAFDLFLGAPSILYDSDMLRRRLYGKAGCFRFKPYGIEYRTLSNFWIKSPEMMEWVYDRAQQAIDFLNSGGTVRMEDRELIEQVINHGDESALTKLHQLYPF